MPPISTVARRMRLLSLSNEGMVMNFCVGVTVMIIAPTLLILDFPSILTVAFGLEERGFDIHSQAFRMSMEAVALYVAVILAMISGATMPQAFLQAAWCYARVHYRDKTKLIELWAEILDVPATEHNVCKPLV